MKYFQFFGRSTVRLFFSYYCAVVFENVWKNDSQICVFFILAPRSVAPGVFVEQSSIAYGCQRGWITLSGPSEKHWDTEDKWKSSLHALLYTVHTFNLQVVFALEWRKGDPGEKSASILLQRYKRKCLNQHTVVILMEYSYLGCSAEGIQFLSWRGWKCTLSVNGAHRMEQALWGGRILCEMLTVHSVSASINSWWAHDLSDEEIWGLLRHVEERWTEVQKERMVCLRVTVERNKPQDTRE